MASAKGTYLVKAIAMASILFGTWWLWMGLHSLFGMHVKKHAHPGVIFFIAVIPGALAVGRGFWLYRDTSLPAVKSVVGLFSVLGGGWISTWQLNTFAGLLPEQIAASVVVLLATCIAWLAYLTVVRALLAVLGHEVQSMRQLLRRGVVMWIAWQVWFLLVQVFSHYAPDDPLWAVLTFIVPIVVAYGGYKFVSARMPASEADQPTGTGTTC